MSHIGTPGSRVGVDTSGGIGWVTLQDPARRNALDLPLARELAGTVRALDADPDVHALVVTGSGTAFCAGADRKVLAEADEDALHAIYDSFLAVRESRQPTVAAVNGSAIGAGLNLALACDVRVASTSARFESRFLQLPIHPGGGHTWMLSRLVSPQTAMALTVFDQPLTGQEAERVGLALRCVPDEDLLDSCRGLCAPLVSSPTPRLGRTIKQALRDTAAMASFADALRYELVRQLDSMQSPEFIDRIGGTR